MLVQVGQFTEAGADLLGAAGPLVYATTTALVLAVILRNWPLTGIPIVAAGATSNLAAIVANGGWMPSDPGALASAGIVPGPGPSNGIVLDEPALRPLTDIFAIPAGLPLANVFSVGDVLIGLGLVVAIAAAMRRGADPGTAAGISEARPPV